MRLEKGNQERPDMLYHVTPLHYLPCIIADGALFAKSILVSKGIAPRASAFRRDRMLGLADYVHLAMKPYTPLLMDKIRKGYPHALLVFDAKSVLALNGTALLAYNTKAWRTRAAMQPITATDEQDGIFRQYFETNRYTSLEVLVKYGLALEFLKEIRFVNNKERRLFLSVVKQAGTEISASCVVDRYLNALHVETSSPATSTKTMEYYTQCRKHRELLSPPAIPFD